MLEHNNNSTEQDKASLEASASTTDARRSFLKKAAIGAPIVIASSAKPAWGAACMSGIMSGNVSNHQHTCDLAGGLSHGHWKNHYVGMKDQHFKTDEDGEFKLDAFGNKKLKNKYKNNPDAYFVKISGQLHFSALKYTDLLGLDGYTLQQALELGGNKSYERELATAFINASLKDIVGYPYDLADVGDIANSVALDSSIADDVSDMLEGIHLRA